MPDDAFPIPPEAAPTGDGQTPQEVERTRVLAPPDGATCPRAGAEIGARPNVPLSSIGKYEILAELGRCGMGVVYNRPTRTGDLLGTPAYMSPELAEGRIRDVDERSDVYQIGAILYELLTGRSPYQAATAMEIVRRIAAEDPVPPQRIDPRIPGDWPRRVRWLRRADPGPARRPFRLPPCLTRRTQRRGGAGRS